MPLTTDQRRRLDEDGFVLVEDHMGVNLLGELRRRVAELYEEEGDQAGWEFKPEPHCRRLANLVDKGEVFRRLLADPLLLEGMRAILGPAIKLSSLNARSVDPQTGWVQPLHADMGALADERGYWVANSVWMLDDFTAENGALRVVPGSHRWGKLPQDVVPDLLADHPQQVLVTGRAGGMIMMNAHLWHGGIGNRTHQPRTAVHVFFCRRDKPQQQYQKQLVRVEIQQQSSPALRDLLALDDPENDRISAQVAVRSGFLK